jgi:glycosyltransferase involved in cell wall biosynthesis
VDLERFFPNVFDKDGMRRRFDLPQNAFVILMVARPDALKRHDLMLSAFASMPPADTHLVLVGKYGEPDVLSRIRRTLVEKDLTQRVTWLPFQDDIREIECAADVVALPSDYEALGMCVLEAMALEIPVVVSDSGGSLELIENGVSGLAMRGGDAASLESALHELRSSAGLRREIGQNARKHVEQQFTLDAHVEQVAAYFRAILV